MKFNVEIDETDVFREDWRTWKTCDAEANRPPPMIIETYLDLAALTRSQSLVLIDDQGKQWNVEEMLNTSSNASLGRSSTPSTRTSHVVLERWTVQLGAAAIDQPADLNALLPAVYKRSIVLFRSLFTYSKFLPAWKFARQSAKSRQLHRALQVRCRIVDPLVLDPPSSLDALTTPLSAGSPGLVTEDFSFGATESPAGPFSISVTYRVNCEFRVDDAEALLSSHFMGLDEPLFRPSLGRPDQLAPPSSAKEWLGSLPTERRDGLDPPDRSQAYGSLSSFHQVGPATGSSPISTLRSARELGQTSASPSPPARQLQNPRSNHSSKSSLRSAEGPLGMTRRPSVSFMPFKTPSLSASPSYGGGGGQSSPRNSLGRTPLVSALTQARNRTSIDAPSPSSLRSVTNPPEVSAPSSGSGSPRPVSVSRYSSSFGHRRGRLSSGGGVTKPEDENYSSGRVSQASSQAQPGSGTLAEGGGTGGSSGSIQTDDDNISDFLKMLEAKKKLKSFESPSAGAEAEAGLVGKRPVMALSKFQKMRESHAVLSDSLSSSLVLQRSSSTSSRQLSSVPPMVVATSLSPSSSPGKPVSPHTPHTPAVPSRLSAQSVAEYAPSRQARHGGGGGGDVDDHVGNDDDDDRDRLVNREGRSSHQGSRPTEVPSSAAESNAIDIPRSPRPIPVRDRRSSSVAQRQRALAIEDETGDLLPFGMRSASLGAAKRQPLSLSTLLGLQDTSEGGISPPDGHSHGRGSSTRARPQSSQDDQSEPMSRQSSSSSQPPRPSSRGGMHSIGTRFRPRSRQLDGGVGSTPTTTTTTTTTTGGSHGEGGIAAVRGDQSHSGGVVGSGGGYDEDEPLLFAMSEIGGLSSRRGLDEYHHPFQPQSSPSQQQQQQQQQQQHHHHRRHPQLSSAAQQPSSLSSSLSSQNVSRGGNGRHRGNSNNNPW